MSDRPSERECNSRRRHTRENKVNRTGDPVESGVGLRRKRQTCIPVKPKGVFNNEKECVEERSHR